MFAPLLTQISKMAAPGCVWLLFLSPLNSAGIKQPKPQLVFAMKSERYLSITASPEVPDRGPCLCPRMSSLSWRICSVLPKTCLSHPCEANVHYDIKHELSMLIQFPSSCSHVEVSLSRILNTPTCKKQNWSPGAPWCDCCPPLLSKGLNAKVKFQCTLYE